MQNQLLIQTPARFALFLTSCSSPVRYPTSSEYFCMAALSPSITDESNRYHLSINSTEYDRVAPKSIKPSCISVLRQGRVSGVWRKGCIAYLSSLPVEKKVGPVWISLHETELEQFRDTKTQYCRTNLIEDQVLVVVGRSKSTYSEHTLSRIA